MAEAEELNSKQNITRQEVIDFTLNACNNAYSKTVASQVTLKGFGVYLSLHKNYSNKEDIVIFNKQICDCVNSKKFNIIDLFYPIED